MSSTHVSRAGSEDDRRTDWEVQLAADAIVARIVRKDAARYGDVVADRYRHHLQRVSERLASRGGYRDERGRVCEARIQAYFNTGPRRELGRILAQAPLSLDDDQHRGRDLPVGDNVRTDPARARIDAFKALIVWCDTLREPVGLAALARARGASYRVIAEVVGVQRNTLVQAVRRNAASAPRAAELVLPQRGVRDRGVDDAGIVQLCAAVLDGYRRMRSDEDGRGGMIAPAPDATRVPSRAMR